MARTSWPLTPPGTGSTSPRRRGSSPSSTNVDPSCRRSASTELPMRILSPSTPTRTGSICRSRTWTASRYYGSSRRRAHPEDRSISITPSVVLAWLPMTTSARGMLVRVSVMVVPDGADVARVGFEEESGDDVDACRRRTADRTRGGSGRVGHRPLPLVRRPAVRAGIVVFRHGSRIGHATRSALEPAVPIHHLFHGEGGDTAKNGLTERTAQNFVHPAALRLRLLTLLRYRLVVSTAKQATKKIIEGIVVGLGRSARLLLSHAAP